MSQKIDFSNWTCPLPLRDQPNVVMGHGGGGKLSAELVENIFLPAFANNTLVKLADSAVLDLNGAMTDGARLAFSTDSFVVKPLFFPGGNIGDLAINGTVNDVAMSGAQPLFLSAGFILEEGLAMDALGRIANTMGAAAKAAGVTLVTGDTKVVNKGHGDGVYINTSGIGVIPVGVNIAPHQARPGDVVIVSGEIGLHGTAIMSVREGLEFETVIETDCAPLNGLVAAMLDVTKDIHILRDPTRGGVASALNEIAKASGVGIVLSENKLPIPSAVRSACELLGLDPLYVANEGKLLAIVPREFADEILAKLQTQKFGERATIIGEVTAQHPNMVVAKTGIGGTRVVDMMIGEQLPRIC
ncbi:MAG: hydrogenase expression/formation protein HypE [Acidobacteria bacterium]|nr:hydrogenase expression/formation protein HypE [Acidobacteriota bacterium]